MRIIDGTKMDLRQPHQLYHLDENGLRRCFQRSDVIVRRHHQVPRRVRIQVQNDEVMRPPIDDMVLLVPVFSALDTEYAPRGVGSLADVLITPGTPQIIHQGVGTGSVGEVWTAAAGRGEVEVFTMSFSSLLGLK